MNDTNIIKEHRMWMLVHLIAKFPSESTVRLEEPIVQCMDDRSHFLYNNCIQFKYTLLLLLLPIHCIIIELAKVHAVLAFQCLGEKFDN